MSGYRTKIVKQINPELISQWKSLWDRAVNATIFNSYEYFLTWQQLNSDQSYELFVCYKKDTLVAIMPLQKQKCYGINVLTTLLNNHLTLTAFLMESYDKNVFRHFFGMFLNKNIFFQKIDSKAAAMLRKTFPQFFLSIISVNPTISLIGDPFEDSSLSTIKQIKKIIRKSDGQLHFEINKYNLQKHFQTMVAIEERSSKKLRGETIFSQVENKDFYKTIIKNRPDLIRICFLYLNNIPIAYQYGYKYKRSFDCAQIAFRNEYSKMRPGKIVLYYLIERMKEDSLLELDLGGGISSYKSEFTSKYRLLYNLYFSPSVAVMYWWKAINTTRRVKQLAFPKKNTRDHEYLFKSA